MWRTTVLALAMVASCHRFDPVEASHVQGTALAIGATAPDVRLTGPSGGQVQLADAFRDHAQTIVVFYRGFY